MNRIAALRGAELALVTALAFAAFSVAPRDARAADAAVSIDSFAFAPASVTVSVGDTVTWTNNQPGVPHTATSDTAGVFDSGTLSTGGSFAKTFSSAGTFSYHCNIHPSMTGTVIVTAASEPTATPTPATTSTTGATPTTAAATATTAAATPTTATSTQPPATGTLPPTVAPTQAPAPPATGDGGGGGDGNTLAILAVIAGAVVIAGGAGYAVMRRRAS